MASFDFMQKALSYSGLSKPDGFNAYGLGNKSYSAGRPMPNIGGADSQAMLGYASRDRALAAQKQALLERMKASNSGAYASAPYLRGQ